MTTKLWSHQKNAVDNSRNCNGLFFEMGCVAGDTQLRLNRAGKGFRIFIKDAYLKFNGQKSKGKPWDTNIKTYSRSLVGEEIRLQEVGQIIYSGPQLVYELTLENGKKLKATADHPIKIKEGYCELLKLTIGQEVLTNGKYCRKGKNNNSYKNGKTIDKDGYIILNSRHDHPNSDKYGHLREHRLVMSEHLGRPLTKNELVHHIDENKKNNTIENLKLVSPTTHHKEHDFGKNLKISRWGDRLIAETSKVVSIVKVGIEETYDVHMLGKHHNFIANGLVVHNTGKTLTALKILEKNRKTLKTNHKFKVLVLAPLSVTRNWEREIATFYDYPYSTFLVSGQSKLKKLKIIKDFNKAAPLNQDIFLLLNIESLRSKEYLRALLDSGIDYIIADESHNFKSPNSLQTKNFLGLIDKLQIKYRYLLTGTPAPQGYIDLWSTLYALKVTNDPFYVWRSKHFIDVKAKDKGSSKYYPLYVLSKESTSVIQKQLADCSFSAKKSEVLDLPPLVKIKRYYKLDESLQEHYNTMLEYMFCIDKEGNELNASNILSRTLRLQQIICGIVGEQYVENSRLEVLKNLIEEIRNQNNTAQILIWTVFSPTYKLIGKLCIELGLKVGFITGKEAAIDRQKYIDAFQDKQLDVLISHPKAGGVGINLTAAEYMIYYSKGYSLTDDLQSEARNYRGGSEIHNSITRFDIVAENTVDELINTALASKFKTQDLLLEFCKLKPIKE